MKPVRRLAAEPPTLAAYRAANPADDMAPADQASQVWRRFRDDPAYAAVKAQVLHEFVQAELQREPTRMPRIAGA